MFLLAAKLRLANAVPYPTTLSSSKNFARLYKMHPFQIRIASPIMKQLNIYLNQLILSFLVVCTIVQLDVLMLWMAVGPA
jgi:hypothetical protein